MINIHSLFLFFFIAVIPDSGRSLGMDILIYIIMATGFVIMGFFVSHFFNKAKMRIREADLDSQKEHLDRRINTLEKEIKHLYSKNDEQSVIINDLRKQLDKAQTPPSSPDSGNPNP